MLIREVFDIFLKIVIRLLDRWLNISQFPSIPLVRTGTFPGGSTFQTMSKSLFLKYLWISKKTSLSRLKRLILGGLFRSVTQEMATLKFKTYQNICLLNI